MRHVSTLVPPTISRGGGGRTASPAYRESLQQCDDFSGLEADTNRFELIHLVKRAGKAAGFTLKMVELLEYYVVHTFDHDWRQGERPIVYQSLARTALALGVSERQIQKLEKWLFEIGAITWRSSGNNKRYGSRDPESGRIEFAYGVELTPLAFLQTELKIKLSEKLDYEQAWIATRREISALRGQIRSVIREMHEGGAAAALVHRAEADYQEIAIQLRTHIKLDAMRSILERHKSLYSRLIDFVEVGNRKTEQPTPGSSAAQETTNGSSRSEQKFAHYKYPNPSKKRKGRPPAPACQESVVAPAEPNAADSEHGREHISLRQLVSVSSERFRAHLHADPGDVSWSEFIEAATRLRAELFISQRSWAEACETLGREAAAISVLITDKALDRVKNPVRKPAAYFREMVNRAKEGRLRLHSSIYGLLEIAETGG